ncbi:MAG TPA: hypothetical protein VGF94_16790 [Kofleriaceae bacterium]|jgi:hypothetical protein
MSIDIQVHDRAPNALAELIVQTMQGGVVMSSEPEVGPLSAMVAAEEREAAQRRAAWHWLNSISKICDHDNDWSDV